MINKNMNCIEIAEILNVFKVQFVSDDTVICYENFRKYLDHTTDIYYNKEKELKEYGKILKLN